jgi:molybdopterin/thiamine biosynthesis adenylyltransferase/rhodanese-related sulfurtransferase/molybdopterin converting factor small subunit
MAMAVKVTIPTALRRLANEQGVVEVSGNTVADVLQNLARQHPQLKKHLFSDDGKLRNFVRVYLNDEDIAHKNGEVSAVKDGDTLTIVPSIAGGVTLPNLSNDEIKRYSRHLILPEVGVEGQKRLKAAKVLLIGSGGLGSPLGMYLAAAGIGTIGMVDFDVVDFSNLQRQIIHFTTDVGKPKLKSAAEKIKALNPNVNFVPHNAKLTSENAMDIIKDYDIVVDGTDNYPTRYLVNDACVLLKKPNVYGSIFRFEGQASVFAPSLGGPCYRCLYPEPPPPGLVPSCAEGGVLGVICGIIGNIQANEAVKLILGKGNPLIGRLLLFDAMDMKFRELKLHRDPNCPICGDNPTIKELIDYNEFCGIGRGEAEGTSGDSIVEKEETLTPDDITVEEVKARLDRGEKFAFIDVRNPDEYEICRIEGTKLIPLPELPQRFREIPDDVPVVLHCHHGGRSMRALKFLRSQGYKNDLKNMAGGIDEWAEKIEPAMPRY